MADAADPKAPAPKAPPPLLDERAQAVIDKSREAVEASRQTLKEARALLRRLEATEQAPAAGAPAASD